MITTTINDIFTTSQRIFYQSPSSGPTGAPCYEVGLDHFRAFDSISIGGSKSGDFKSIYVIYQLIHAQDLDRVIDFSVRPIVSADSQRIGSVQVSSEIAFRIRNKNRKCYYYNRKAIINAVKLDSAVSNNISTSEDIGWMKPGRMGAYRLNGVDTSAFDLKIPESVVCQDTPCNRELEILKIVSRGFTSRYIAGGLRLSTHTGYANRRNMLRKMEAANTPELLMTVRDMNLLL